MSNMQMKKGDDVINFWNTMKHRLHTLTRTCYEAPFINNNAIEQL